MATRMMMNPVVQRSLAEVGRICQWMTLSSKGLLTLAGVTSSRNGAYAIGYHSVSYQTMKERINDIQAKIRARTDNRAKYKLIHMCLRASYFAF